MAAFKLVTEAEKETKYIAYLLHNLRFYTIKSENTLSSADLEKKTEFERLSDAWLKESVVVEQ